MFPFLGEATTCYKMNQFFLSYRIAKEDPNCRLAENFNSVLCGCEGSGYAGANSQAKRTALVWIPRMSALLSFCGSFVIIFYIVRDPSKRRKTNGQLMVTMSVFDLMGSAAYAFTSFPISKGAKTPICKKCFYQSDTSLNCPTVLFRFYDYRLWRERRIMHRARLLHPNGNNSSVCQCFPCGVLLLHCLTSLVTDKDQEYASLAIYLSYCHRTCVSHCWTCYWIL